MNLFARQHTATQRDIEKVLGKKLSEVSKEEILDLFPEGYGDRRAKVRSSLCLTVYPNPWSKQKTWWQRLNHVWVLPLHCLIVGPVLWVCTGKFGIEPTSKVGKVLMKLVGE